MVSYQTYIPIAGKGSKTSDGENSSGMSRTRREHQSALEIQMKGKRKVYQWVLGAGESKSSDILTENPRRFGVFNIRPLPRST